MRCSSKPLVSMLALALVVPALAQRLTVIGSRASQYPIYATNNDVVQVAFDGSSGALLHADGRVHFWLWGGNDNVFALPATKIGMYDVSGEQRVGRNTIYALLKDGTIHTSALQGVYSSQDDGKIEGLSNVKDLFSAPASGVLALKDDGTLALVAGNAILTPPSGLRDVAQADLCMDNGIALRKDGTVVVWGANGNKQLQVPRGLRDVVQVAAGYHAFMALKKDGLIVQWGTSTFRYEYVTPVSNAAPVGLPPVKRISMSTVGAHAILTDGRVVTWGTVGTTASDTLPAALLATRAVVSASDDSSRATTIVVSGVSLTLDRPRLHVYGSTTGRVALPFKAPGGGSVVTLSASDPSVSIPASVVVPEGKSEVAFPIGSLSANPPAEAVTLTANVAGQTDSVPLAVYGKVPDVDTDVSEVVGGSAQTLTATYYLDVPYAKPQRAILSAAAAVSPTVAIVVPAGARTVSARFTFKPTATPIQTTVTASNGITNLSSAPFRVVPLTARLEVGRWTPYAGQKPELFLSLNAPLPTPRLATLASTDPKALGVPTGVTVPAGVTAFPIEATSLPVGDDRSVLLTSALLGSVGEERLTARGIAPAMSFTPNLIGGGATTPVTLAIPEPLDVPFTLGLTSDVPGVASVPSSLIFAPGNTSTTFPVTTAPTDSVVPAKISATFDGRTSGGTLTVAPAIRLSIDPVAELVFGTTQSQVRGMGVSPLSFYIPLAIRADRAPLVASPFSISNDRYQGYIGSGQSTWPAGTTSLPYSSLLAYHGYLDVLEDTWVTVTATNPLALAPASRKVLVKPNPLFSASLSSATTVGGSTRTFLVSRPGPFGTSRSVRVTGPATTCTASLDLYALTGTPLKVSCNDPDVTFTSTEDLIPRTPSVPGPEYFSITSRPSWPIYAQPVTTSGYNYKKSVTFGVMTKKVTTTKTVTITVTAGGVTKTLALTITP